LAGHRAVRQGRREPAAARRNQSSRAGTPRRFRGDPEGLGPSVSYPVPRVAHRAAGGRADARGAARHPRRRAPRPIRGDVGARAVALGAWEAAMQPVRCGVWGVGTWGEKHARVYHTLEEAELVGVYDHHPGRAAEVAERYACRAFESEDELLEACE